MTDLMPFAVRNQEDWDKSVQNNQDPYGAGCIRYAARWANIMEAAIAENPALTVAEVASKASHDADTEGITGFMYGCAVGILAHCWEHGEALRRWHNIDTQLGNEGEKANEKGTVLNPAVIGISKA